MKKENYEEVQKTIRDIQKEDDVLFKINLISKEENPTINIVGGGVNLLTCLGTDEAKQQFTLFLDWLKSNTENHIKELEQKLETL